ncbi:hypothetical protein L484_021890 [Morus notabilis]|uniref:Uncharacterized protein n=1 Tax=Morus notabilis TaxID=981085 RepID=W9SBZ1_9ROSA|nr:hypothetical protein L484_021890 [Morus notabilis]
MGVDNRRRWLIVQIEGGESEEVMQMRIGQTEMVDWAFVRRRFKLLLLTIALPVIKDNEKEVMSLLLFCCSRGH